MSAPRSILGFPGISWFSSEEWLNFWDTIEKETGAANKNSGTASTNHWGRLSEKVYFRTWSGGCTVLGQHTLSKLFPEIHSKLRRFPLPSRLLLFFQESMRCRKLRKRKRTIPYNDSIFRFWLLLLSVTEHHFTLAQSQQLTGGNRSH